MRTNSRLPSLWRSCTPLLLCASPTVYERESESTIDKLVGTLEQRIAMDLTALSTPLRDAWDAGWKEQLQEIADLDATLAADDSSDDNDQPELDLPALWRQSENMTGADAKTTLRTARNVTQQLMKFWRTATPRNDNLDDDLREEIGYDLMPRETALRERRRQLRRHAAAGLVEYRIFGEVLSRDEAVLDTLPSAGIATLDSAWRQLGGVANRTGMLHSHHASAKAPASVR